MNNDELRVGALYIRVSTHDQDELSPDAQTRLGLDYAKSNNIIVPKEYIFVESVSGRNASKRKEFQRMISIAKSTDHPIDVIIVWKFSRFARNQEESIVYKSMLKKDGIDVLSVSEPLVDGPFGSLIERIIEWMDEYYSIRLSDEVIRGMSEKALRGGYQITPPLGYDAVGDGKPFVINEEEFKFVAYIFDKYDNHNYDFSKIARHLNNIGAKTKRGSNFDVRSVKRTLENPFYYGLVRWKEYEFIGQHETRITKEQYDNRMKKMQSMYRPSRRREVSVCKHWLSGIVKCGVCGASLVFNGYNRRSPCFQCWRYAKGAHELSMCISEKKLVQAVYEYLEKILEGSDFKYTYRAPVKSDNSEQISEIMNELKKLDTREARIKLAYENEIDTLEEYKENKNRIKSMRESLQDQLRELESAKSDSEPSKKEVTERIRTVYDVIRDPDVDIDTKGTFIRSIVEDIVFDKENQSLIFHLYAS